MNTIHYSPLIGPLYMQQVFPRAHPSPSYRSSTVEKEHVFIT